VTAALIMVAGAAVALASGPLRAARAVWSWLRIQWLGILAALAVFVLVSVPLYTVGFAHPEDWAFPVKAISYWWHQHTIHRVSGPWWYYLPRLAQYEFLALGAALVWTIRRIRRLRRIEIFLIVFALESVATYCYLGEKTPWLAVHQVWPFVPLAGAQLARTFGRRGRWWSRTVAGAALVGTLATSLCANFVLDEITPARQRVESLIFVQTCPEVKTVVADGLAAASAHKGAVAAAVSGEAAWPLMWYWRHLQIWWGTPARDSKPPIVICDPEREAEVRKSLGPGYSRQRIPLRAWWLMYQEKPTVKEVLRYLVTRKPWGGIGSTDVIVLRREKEGGQPITHVEVPSALAQSLRVTGATVIGSGWFGEPRGVALLGRRLAVADAALGRLFVVSSDDELEQVPVRTVLNQPEAVAWSAPNLLYVADTWNHRILRVDVNDGSFWALPIPKGGWYGPRSVAVSESGRLAVADTGNKRVVIFDPKTSHLTLIGKGGSSPGEFVEPGGVAWLNDSSFVVCDTGNHRVQVLDTAGKVRSVVLLPDAWSDFYSRPQIAVLGPHEWIATDTPGQALWRYRNGKVTRIDLSTAGIRPTGIAWDSRSRRLAVGDLSGKVWVLEVIRV
jgi:sugar lactone lactonase YvrE